MGNHAAEIGEVLPPAAFKFQVHAQMCLELLKMVVRVSKIFPEIEAARPRCSAGIEALCMLNNGIAKAKSLLQYCRESSALYLALTGDAILSRCKKSRNLLEQSLCQIQSMVQVILASKISGIIADLRSAPLDLDPSEEEAGRILRELLHQYGSTVDSTEEAALAVIRTVSSRLHISSQKALQIEKRSLEKLIDKFGDSEPSKRKILLFFMNLLRKYGKVIAEEQKHDVDWSNEAQVNISSNPAPPEEFICPLSSRLMHDPVVIASGQTYERKWIQKWFDEGHETCPKTNEKLPNLCFTSNHVMKELIMKWPATHGSSVPDPKVQERSHRSWDSTTSIASLTSSMDDLNLLLDFSNASLGSSFTSQCNSVEDVKKLLTHHDQSWSGVPSGRFVQVILQFLKDAHDLHDVQAQMTGCLLLLEVLQRHGNMVSYLKDDEYDLLASLLDTEVSKQVLSILVELSSHQECRANIAASGALVGIFNILDSRTQELFEPALKILTNMSSNDDAGSFIAPSEVIPKLIPLFEDDSLASHCIRILKNLWDRGEARMAVAETDGCIASIVKELDKQSEEEQEQAAFILLSLCSQRGRFCQLVMKEGVIPGLVSVSVNGNERARGMAMELLRILKEEVLTGRENSGSDISVEATRQQNESSPRRASGFLRKIFSKSKKKYRLNQ